ncbi:MAG: substrate-binding domain-containing protein [Acidimicrobiales bacterium]|jgi:phosphate transport system substrate-binding protein
MAPTPANAGTGLIGDGSSFAGPEVQQWVTDTAKPPYTLTVDYSPYSSAQGRFDFANRSVDFAVSDIPYQARAFDTAQPTFPFIYVPVTAGGLAFMYHLNGLPSGTTLQLSSYSACALMTGGVKTWNDPIIAADNPGVSLPSTAVHPVIRSDLAGTNFVLQEYCIHEQPALWRDFVTSPAVTQEPGQVDDLSPTSPRSDWPLFPGIIEASGSDDAASDVAAPNNDGYITGVETAYAIKHGLPVASVKNASGYYMQPGADNVASALAYATQNADGTHNLNFDGAGKYVYNPSTYSYLLTPTTGWSAAKGNVLSQFANYALTLGQQKAPEIGYASLGLSLEQYGVNSIKAAVPGAVALTSAEQGAYQCGDLTPAEVRAGQTKPTCGVTNTNNSATPGEAANGNGSTGAGAVTASGTSARSGQGTFPGVDPGVSLTGSSALAFTGINPLPIVLPGLLLIGVGWAARRRLRARIR